MFIQQSALLWGMDKEFVQDFMEIAMKETREAGEILFNRGERADCFYILMKGHIRLTTGEVGHVVHVIDHAGEAFGWSSLVGRDVYSATAECVAPTNVIKIENEKLWKIFERRPADGVIFFQRLAKILGDRLIRSYEVLPNVSQAQVSMSYGTRQVMDIGTE
jgi:CRP-like cAMP-binding protein